MNSEYERWKAVEKRYARSFIYEGFFASFATALSFSLVGWYIDRYRRPFGWEDIALLILLPILLYALFFVISEKISNYIFTRKYGGIPVSKRAKNGMCPSDMKKADVKSDICYGFLKKG